jgi:hypothetical protein
LTWGIGRASVAGRARRSVTRILVPALYPLQGDSPPLHHHVEASPSPWPSLHSGCHTGLPCSDPGIGTPAAQRPSPGLPRLRRGARRRRPGPGGGPDSEPGRAAPEPASHRNPEARPPLAPPARPAFRSLPDPSRSVIAGIRRRASFPVRRPVSAHGITTFRVGSREVAFLSAAREFGVKHAPCTLASAWRCDCRRALRYRRATGWPDRPIPTSRSSASRSPG